METHKPISKYFVDLNDIDVDRIIFDINESVSNVSPLFLQVCINYQYTPDIILPLFVKITDLRVDHFGFKRLIKFYQRYHNNLKMNKLLIPFVHQLNVHARLNDIISYIRNKINNISKSKNIVSPIIPIAPDIIHKSPNFKLRLESSDKNDISAFKIKTRLIRLGGMSEHNTNRLINTIGDLHDMLSDTRYIWRSKTPFQDRNDPSKPHYLADIYISVTGWFKKESYDNIYYHSASIVTDCEHVEFRYNKSSCISTIALKPPIVVKSRVLVL